MARGIYSALGFWPDADVAGVVERLRAVARDLDRDTTLAEPARAALAVAVREIRAFEARVGAATGIDAEVVSTPTGRAIELGNHGHRGFGAEHEDAAARVARALADLLTALGATRVMWFTMD